MSAPRWSRGPDTLGVNGVDYGDAQQTGYAIADSVGRVYFITGGSTDTWLRLDPPYTTWSTMANIESGMGDGGEIRIETDDDLLIVGGANVYGGGARYDPTNDPGYNAFAPPPWNPPWVVNWTTVPPGFQPILDPLEAWYYSTSCRTPDGKNWVIGGGVQGGAGVNIVGYIEAGDPAWTRVTDMPGSAREGHSSCVDPSGRIYVFGGNVVSDDQPEEATLSRYTPSTDTWEALAQLTTPITGTNGLVRPIMVSDPQGRVYVMGGINNTGSAGSVFVYDGAWHQLADLPDGLVTTITGTAGESQPAFIVDDRIIVFAYASDLSASAVVAYDLKNGRWGKPIYTETLHLRGGFTVTDTHAFILGGNDGGGNTSAVEKIRVSDLAAFSGLHLASLSWRGEA